MPDNAVSTTPENPFEPARLSKLDSLLRRLKGGLIVSCQAEDNEPLHGSVHMAAMALAAFQGGAVGIRANGPEDISAIHYTVNLPIIGIYKQDTPGYAVRITPTLESAQQVAQAGADIIAIDATSRPHPDGISLPDRIRLIHERNGCPIMADVSTYDEGLSAQNAGADLVATTLSGYTEASPHVEPPDFDLLSRLASSLSVPLIAEGRISTPDQAMQAIRSGAFAVVVGSAITRPQWITSRFIKRMAEV
jgi:N-acylglucosamine-6-phosphate 2-epimerase